MILRSFGVVCVLFAARSICSGTVVFSTFGPNQTFSDKGNIVGTYMSGYNHTELANSFTPASTYTLDQISVSIGSLSGPTQVTVYLASGATEPGPPIESFNFTGVGFGAQVRTAVSALHPFLIAGQRYWVVVSPTDPAASADVWWNQSTAFPAGELALQRDSASFPAWHAPSFGPGLDEAFEVDGTATPNGIRFGVLSHIAAGGGWNTVITLVNTSSTEEPVVVALHNDDGSALPLPVTVTQQGASQTNTTDTVKATLNPNGTLLISVGDQISSTVVGWADVMSVARVDGFAIFRQTPQTGPPSEGTVSLQTQFPSAFSLPFDDTAGFVMGVALANLSASSATITATIWDDDGNQLGTQNFSVPGSGHTAFVLPSQIVFTPGRRGVVQFKSSSTDGIAGLGLRFSPFGTFTSVPTISQ